MNTAHPYQVLILLLEDTLATHTNVSCVSNVRR